jgi:hypothetical protein
MSCFAGEVSSFCCCQVSMASPGLDNGVEVEGRGRPGGIHRARS